MWYKQQVMFGKESLLWFEPKKYSIAHFKNCTSCAYEFIGNVKSTRYELACLGENEASTVLFRTIYDMSHSTLQYTFCLSLRKLPINLLRQNTAISKIPRSEMNCASVFIHDARRMNLYVLFADNLR